MKSSLKTQMRLIRTIRKSKESLAMHPSLKKIKTKEAQILNDVYSTLAAVNMIGEKKIHALPDLLDYCKVIVEIHNKGIRDRDIMKFNNTMVRLSKLLKELK